MKNYNIEIEGAFGEGNFGDDALLNVLHRELTKSYAAEDIIVKTKIGAPTKRFEWLCPNSQIYTPGEGFCPKVTNKIYGGGTQFFDFGERKSVLKKIYSYGRMAPKIFIRKIRNHFENTKPNMNRTHYIGIGIGPFSGGGISSEVQRDLTAAATLSVRDSNSASLLEHNGVEYIKYTDLCFLEEAMLVNSPSQTLAKKVLIIPRDWPANSKESDHERFLDTITRSTDLEYHFALVGHDPCWRKALKKRKIPFYSYTSEKGGINRALEHFSKFDIIVSARYHGLVYASLMGIPSIAIALEPKLSIAVVDLNLAGLVAPDRISEIPKIIHALDMEKERKVLLKTVDEHRIKAQEMLSELLAKI